MDVLDMIGELREEWARLNDAIVALERLKRGTARRRGRPSRATAASTAEGDTRSGAPAHGAAARKRANAPENAAEEPLQHPPE